MENETKIPKRSVTIEYKFGYLSEAGYRHFPMLYLAWGKNGFSLCIIGLTITVKMW